MFKKLLICLNFITFVLLTSCWGKVDVDDLSIAAAIGIDKSENGFKVTAQVVNASAHQKEGSKNASIIVYSEEGETVFEAVRKLTSLYPSRIFIGHFQILVLGEELAREGLIEPIIMFFIDHESKHKFDIAVVKGGKAEDLLKVITPQNKTPASEIVSKIESSTKGYGLGNNVYMDEVISRTKSIGNNIVLQGIEIEGPLKEGGSSKNLESSSPKTKIKISSLAVFKKEKLVGWLDESQSQGYNHIKGNIKGSLQVATFGEDDKVSFEIKETKVKYSFNMEEEIPSVIINYEVKGNVATILSGKTVLSTMEYEEIKKDVSKRLKEKMMSTLEMAQKEYKSDIFGFGSMIHKKNLKYWNTIKENYNDVIFPKMKIEVSVETTVLRGY